MFRNAILFLYLVVGSKLVFPFCPANYLNNDSTFYALDEFVPGNSYFGRNNYIEYIAGELPLVISAPHGGYEKPDKISDRTKGSVRQDKKTLETILAVKDAIHGMTGKYPHIIINRLHRVKLDPNRTLDIAAQKDSIAAISYKEFHEFIDIAQRVVEKDFGWGLYIDLHAHMHKESRLELGYLLESEILYLNDEDLNDDLFIEKSSLKNLMENTTYTFSEVIRGKVSLGALFCKYNYPAIPSPEIPAPSSEFFFSGGYNTQVHGSQPHIKFDGIQLELYYDGIRDSRENIAKFSEAFVKIISEYLKIHYGYNLIPDGN